MMASAIETRKEEEGKDVNDNKEKNLPPFAFEVFFHKRRFMMQLLAHLMMPFTGLFYPIFRGAKASRRQGFWPQSFGMFIVNVLMPSLVLFSISWFIVFFKDLTSKGVMVLEIIVLIVVVLSHRLMVSIKYAYITTPEFEWFSYCNSDKAALSFLLESQLLTGWFNPSRHLIRREVRKSQALSDQSLRFASFKVLPNQLEKWKRTMSLPYDDKDASINGEDFLVELIWYCSQNALNFTHCSYVALFASCAMAFALPGLSRVVTNTGPFLATDSIPNVVFFVINGVSLAFYTNVIITFVFCYFQDCIRRAIVLRRMGKLLIKRDLLLSKNGEVIDPGHKVPRIDVDDIHELESWIACKLVFLNYGRMWTDRMSLYNITVFSLCLIIVIYMMVEFVSDFNDSAKLKSNSTLFYVIIVIIVMTITGSVSIVLASRVNSESEKHRALLGRLRIESLTSGSSSSNRTKSKEIINLDENDDQRSSVIGTSRDLDQPLRFQKDNLLQSGLDIFEHLDRDSPLKYLGVKATQSNAVTLLAFFASFILLFVNSVFF